VSLAINKDSQYSHVAAVNIELLDYGGTSGKGVRIYNAAVRVNREQHCVADKKDKINTVSLPWNDREIHTKMKKLHGCP